MKFWATTHTQKKPPKTIIFIEISLNGHVYYGFLIIFKFIENEAWKMAYFGAN